MAGEAYLTANRALDRNLELLTHEKAELVAALRSPLHEDFVDASIRQFCASARARFKECVDFDAKRQFLVGHVERVIYRPLQDHAYWLGPGTVGIGANQAAIPHRG